MEGGHKMTSRHERKKGKGQWFCDNKSWEGGGLNLILMSFIYFSVFKYCKTKQNQDFYVKNSEMIFSFQESYYLPIVNLKCLSDRHFIERFLHNYNQIPLKFWPRHKIVIC